MKSLALLFLLMATTAFGSGPFAFPVAGALKVEKATYYLNGDRTGGSVSVVLRDSNGTSCFVHYRTKDAGEEHGGGLLTFRAEKEQKGTTFARGSEDETRLLQLLRAACVASYGSADPVVLKEPSNRPGATVGFDRMAMASLLRHFPTKPAKEGGTPATGSGSQ